MGKPPLVFAYILPRKGVTNKCRKCTDWARKVLTPLNECGTIKPKTTEYGASQYGGM